MISKITGTILRKNTKPKTWWIKLGISIILSNVFVLILFSEDSAVRTIQEVATPGWVEVQLNAELMTPFHSGKKVLIIHRVGRKKLEGVLKTPGLDNLGKITVLVKEQEAHALFQYESWEVLPYLKHLTFTTTRKEDSHEIHY